MSVFAELTDDAVAFLKAGGHLVKAFVTSEADKAQVYLKQAAENEPLVTKTLNLVSDLESKQMTGAAKMDAVVEDILDGVTTALAEGGFGHLVSEAASLARGLGQMVFTDLRAGLAKL